MPVQSARNSKANYVCSGSVTKVIHNTCESDKNFSGSVTLVKAETDAVCHHN